jgi:hypothetical protein
MCLRSGYVYVLFLCKNHDFCTKHHRLISLSFLRLQGVDASVTPRAASSRPLVACATRV